MSGVCVDRPTDGVARVTLDRPPVNALDEPAFRALADAFRMLAAEDGVRCVVLTAAGGRTFSAGTDLAAFATPEGTAAVSAAAIDCFSALAALPQPLIGALNAPAIGVGAMLAAQLDLLVAHPGVRFVLPEVGAGFPGGGSHVARLASWFKVQRMVLLGEPLTAAEAQAQGTLAELVADPSAVGPAALALARKVAALSPAAVRPARHVLRATGDEAAMAGYRAELQALAHALHSPAADAGG